MQLTAKTFWLPLNQATQEDVVDAVSNAAMAIPTGNAVTINCAAFTGDPSVAANLDTITNVTSATLDIYQNNAAGTLLYEGTVPYASFNNPVCTYANWSTQADYQFGFQLTPTQTNWTISSPATELDIWWSITLQTSAGPITIGQGAGTVYLSGLSETPSTVVNNPTYYTAAQVDAQIAAASSNFIPTITGVTGGGSTNLDGLNALARPVGQLIQIIVPGSGLLNYQVQAGTAATAAPGSIRCADFNASTNAKLFVLVS
jgi:hypothetical protein